MRIERIIENVCHERPLIHHITNYVTANDCANIVLACGGSPIMADDVAEVEEMTSLSKALVLNLGTLNQRTIESMLLAGKKANGIGIPVILDPVGVGASTLRNETTFRLLDEISFAVIRGNVSEMKMIGLRQAHGCGVDASVGDVVNELNLDEMVDFAKRLSESLGAVIVMTGAIDIVGSRDEAFVIRNGHGSMAYITGTGCMLSSVIATFVGANLDTLPLAAAVATALMGRCGEVAHEKMQASFLGYSSMKLYLMDAMSQVHQDHMKGGLNIERRG
ncbi:MAG TPA: hydroxyethylthiazole kinase [Firmicutes bacterium]|nr:hydroxyethylthiazole kinase [Bacillota bacterium]